MEKKIRAMELIAEGNYCVESKNYKKAPTYFEQAINIDPNDKDLCKYAWYNMGVAYFHLKDYKKVIEYNKRVVEIDPQYEMAWNNRLLG
jgi:tetratricopeptide (TPR) repeat protein